jgi:hypothetical protein
MRVHSTACYALFLGEILAGEEVSVHCAAKEQETATG